MNGKEYVGFGIIFTLGTGISEFVFDYPVNAFGMSIGIILAGIIIILYEHEMRNFSKRKNLNPPKTMEVRR